MMAAEYNFFRLNASGVVDTAKLVRLSDDAAAIAHAREMYHSGQVEVWSGKRKIATVPPMIDRRGADRRTTH
jgi:hypothetical protein